MVKLNDGETLTGNCVLIGSVCAVLACVMCECDVCCVTVWSVLCECDMCCAVWQWCAVMCGATAELIPTPVYLVPCCSKVSVVDDAAGYSKEIEVWVPLLPPCQGFTHAWLHPCLQVGLQSHHVQIVSCHDNLTMRRPVWGTIMKMMHAHTHAHTHTHTHTP